MVTAEEIAAIETFAPLGRDEQERLARAAADIGRGEEIHYLRFPAAGSGSIGLRQALEEQEFELYAPGLHHLALAVESSEDVDAVHERVVEAGGEVLHEPRLWPEYHAAYYAVFFLDPDGFRIEVAGSRDSRL